MEPYDSCPICKGEEPSTTLMSNYEFNQWAWLAATFVSFWVGIFVGVLT